MTQHPSRQRLLAKVTGSAATAALGASGAAAAQTGAGAGAGTSTASPRRAVPAAVRAVSLLGGPFRANQSRSTAYLRFVDITRLPHTFRRNVGLPSNAQPRRGWESPTTELRGHSTGHLLSGLALTYADTGDDAVRAKRGELVAAPAERQAASPAARYGQGYLSAYPESFFDRLEAGSGVWAPYGLVDQRRLAGSQQALDVVLAQAEWLDRRTAALSPAHLRRVPQTEYGGMNDVLADLFAVTADARRLDVAERFTHDVDVDFASASRPGPRAPSSPSTAKSRRIVRRPAAGRPWSGSGRPATPSRSRCRCASRWSPPPTPRPCRPCSTAR